MSHISLFGDHLARQQRDPAGLAGALFRVLDEASSVPVPVRDYTVEGPVRETVRRLSDVIDRLPAGVLVFVVGAADSRAGGPPPAAFLNELRMIATIAKHAGSRVLFVIPPAPPIAIPDKALRGYAKGSRRWLARIGPIVQADPSLGPVTLLAALPDATWADPLTLRPDGLYSLAKQIVGRILAA